MDHQTTGLLSTLVVCLVAAFAGGLTARSIKLPPLLGYILAGTMIGPFTPGFVANQQVASELADVGVALILFNIGLHFSLKDLLAVRKIAIWGAVIQVGIGCAIGALSAFTSFDSSWGTALMIGLALSIASTAISSRLLDERHQIGTLAGRIAMGWLVVQDLMVVIALVLFPLLLKAQRMEVNELALILSQSILQIAGFMFVVVLGARKSIPKLLDHVARTGSRELFTLAVIVIALGIAYGSSILFGVSIALGAFFAGVVIGESDFNHHAAAEALSMQQVFSILFFVSIGMLLDPASLAAMPWNTFGLWLWIVLSIGMVSFLLLLFLRVPPNTAALVGGIFSQIGEFSFVLCQLGYDWGMLDAGKRDLILAVAFASIALNPLVLWLFLKAGQALDDSNLLMRWRRDGEFHFMTAPETHREHVILVGHGRVGQLVSTILSEHHIPFIAIEADRKMMEHLRHIGTPVVFGDASREAVLQAAQPMHAKLLIVTIPESSQVRRIVALAKRVNPKLDIIVRVHEDNEAQKIKKLGVGLAVMGEREIAFGLLAYALERYSVASQDILQSLAAIRLKKEKG